MAPQFVNFGAPPSCSHKPVPIPENGTLEEKIIAVLRNVYDPEISVNIYDLGLIYKIDIDQDSHVNIDMTLTSPNCPVAGSLPGQVECTVNELDEVASVKVKLVWDPPWDRDRISDEAKLALGIL